MDAELLRCQKFFPFCMGIDQHGEKYKIDAIHAEYASMGQYLWIRRLFPHIKFNIVEHDMTAQSYERKVADSHGLKRTYLKFQLDRVLKKKENIAGEQIRYFH